jgi:hypothetical protein
MVPLHRSGVEDAPTVGAWSALFEPEVPPSGLLTLPPVVFNPLGAVAHVVQGRVLTLARLTPRLITIAPPMELRKWSVPSALPAPLSHPIGTYGSRRTNTRSRGKRTVAPYEEVGPRWDNTRPPASGSAGPGPDAGTGYPPQRAARGPGPIVVASSRYSSLNFPHGSG